MGLTQVSKDGVKNDAIDASKLPANSVGASELADNAVDTNAIADQAVALSKLPHGDGSSNGKFLRANNGADPSFESIPAGTTINNNANNRLITGSGTANTLEGEVDISFDGAHLELSNGKGIRTNYIRPTQSGNTNTGNAIQQYWKIGDINLNGSEGAVITLFGANGYSAGSTQYAAETTIVLRGSNGNTLLGFWYSDSGSAIATYSDVRWKYSSGTTFELWVSAGSFNNVAPIVKTTGTFDQSNAAGTGTNNPPTGSTALPSNHCKQVGSIQTIEYQSSSTIFKRNITMSNGYGIDFSATSDASGKTSELLDDYETGTWVPQFRTSGGGSATPLLTYSSRGGRYIKVGKLVYVSCSMNWYTKHNSGSGLLLVENLPFTISSSEKGTGGAPSFNNVDVPSASTIASFCTELSNGTTYFYAGLASKDNAGWQNIDASAINNSGNYRVQFCYEAA